MARREHERLGVRGALPYSSRSFTPVTDAGRSALDASMTEKKGPMSRLIFTTHFEESIFIIYYLSSNFTVAGKKRKRDRYGHAMAAAELLRAAFKLMDPGTFITGHGLCVRPADSHDSALAAFLSTVPVCEQGAMTTARNGPRTRTVLLRRKVRTPLACSCLKRFDASH